MIEPTALPQRENAWFSIPSAILPGILHGLEPRHPKVMMVVFIIAIKGIIK